jgi:hypothetical protein
MFKLQNYNEFKNHVRWHDYFAIMINEFAVVQVRRYEWFDKEQYTFVIQVLGFAVFHRTGNML